MIRTVCAKIKNRTFGYFFETMKNKYKELAQNLLNRINDNTYPNLKLPTERELCLQFSVSRSTVREALSILEDERVITKKHGSGIYILPEYYASKNTIALIVNNKEAYIFPLLTGLLKDRLNSFGFSLNTFETQNDPANEREILESILKSNFQAIICEPSRANLPTVNYDLYTKLLTKNIPTLFINDKYTNLPDFPLVTIDGYHAAYNMVKSFESSNLCGIFLSERASSVQKYLGYARAVLETGNKFNSENVLMLTDAEMSEIRSNKSCSRLNRFMEQHIHYDGLICDNDEIAYSITTCHNPDSNMTLYSFDNSYLCKLIKHSIVSYGVDMSKLIDSISLSIMNLIKKEPAGNIVLLPKAP